MCVCVAATIEKRGVFTDIVRELYGSSFFLSFVSSERVNHRRYRGTDVPVARDTLA